jgi:hypothetical protein
MHRRLEYLREKLLLHTPGDARGPELPRRHRVGLSEREVRSLQRPRTGRLLVFSGRRVKP